MDSAKNVAPSADLPYPTRETSQFTGLSPSQMWRRYTADPPTFPRPHYIGERRFWLFSELLAWREAEFNRPASARRCGRGLRHCPPLAPVPEPESR